MNSLSYCGQKMLLASPVNNECGHEPLQLPAAVHLRGLEVEKNRTLAQTAEAHIKGMIPISPDSGIFPYTEKHYNH